MPANCTKNEPAIATYSLRVSAQLLLITANLYCG